MIRRIELTDTAIESYIDCIDRSASRVDAREVILAAVSSAMDAQKRAHRREDSNLYTVRCPARRIRGASVRLRFEIIVHADRIDVIRSLPPHSGWRPQ